MNDVHRAEEEIPVRRGIDVHQFIPCPQGFFFHWIWVAAHSLVFDNNININYENVIN
jgi:hypothetical protein